STRLEPRWAQTRERSCGRLDELLRPRVVALLVIAQELAPVSLGRLLDQVRGTTFRALFIDWTVPQHEVAVRVIRAAEKHLAAFRFALDDLAALVRVLRAPDARRLVFDVPAVGIVRTGGEFAKPTVLQHQLP